MKTNKNYNALANRGIAIDDMEFVKQFNLDPALAYTPQLNDAILDSIYHQNVKGFVELEGMSTGRAKAEAGRLRADARKAIALSMS